MTESETPEPAPRPPRGVLDWPVAHGLGDAMARELAARARRRSRRRHALGAASVLALAMVAAWTLPFAHEQRPLETDRVVVHAPPLQTLPDGSTVELREGAVFSMDFSGGFRRVALSGGEAHFQVAKDASRPFIVTAAGVDVCAVGTAFSVAAHSAARIEVVVTEGRVVVSDPGSAEPARPAELGAGEIAVVARPMEAAARVVSVTRPDEEEIAARQEWRAPRLEFSDTPLAEAIAALNKKAAEKLLLADNSLAGLRVSGIVRADNSAALVRLLVANYPVAAERGPDGMVRLRRR